MVRNAIYPDKPGTNEYQAVHMNLMKQPADPTVFTRFLQDPSYRMTRDLASIEQRIDLTGKPRGGYPIFGTLNDSEKENSQGTALNTGFVSALDETISSGKRGPKDGDHVMTEGNIVGIPRPIKKADDDSDAENDDATVISTAGNPTGSSEPDPT